MSFFLTIRHKEVGLIEFGGIQIKQSMTKYWGKMLEKIVYKHDTTEYKY